MRGVACFQMHHERGKKGRIHNGMRVTAAGEIDTVRV